MNPIVVHLASSSVAALVVVVCLGGCAAAQPRSAPTTADRIPAWTRAHGHDSPLVAIAGENGGTELTDFAIPYGVLKRTGIDTLTVAAHDAPIRFRPALTARLDATMAEFDREHPEGADCVIVPAMVNPKQPTSLALVEAIAGRDRAEALAREIDVADWSPAHETNAFRPHYGNLRAYAVGLLVNPFLRRSQRVGVPLLDGIDEIALAVVADAYSRTGRSQAVSVASTRQPVASRFGLRFLPEVVGASETLDVVLPRIAGTAPGKVFDVTLSDLERRYGRDTAVVVAVQFEYPGYAP